MTPATVEDAYTMLIEAVAIDDPVVYCEHKYLYYHLKGRQLAYRRLAHGRARIARKPRSHHCLLQRDGHEALSRGGQLVNEVLEIEVVDLRSVKPLDTNTVFLPSVRGTGRLLCGGESFRGAAQRLRLSLA